MENKKNSTFIDRKAKYLSNNLEFHPKESWWVKIDTLTSIEELNKPKYSDLDIYLCFLCYYDIINGLIL